jgi:tetratricopeptide (TPR) repeat protein
MRIWGIAAIAALAITSFGAENIAPTKSELEEMYKKAFREFEANNFSQALKELDAIDARQPDLAASQNLRGVILMRQGVYDKAEAAMLEAARIDPKFWNARFNLAEIPFLQKNWVEARNRFQKLLSSSQSDLASEATQLIQYKILLTYLLEGKENMVDSILAKLELSSDTPAVHYVKAAVALQHKNEKEAKDWMGVAEKNFSPQLNKLFVESFYEVGWLERPGGEGRASMPLMTAGERKEKAKATARAKFEQAQEALRQRDLAAARKLIDEADQIEPNQPATLNLRGEILMAQKEFDQAEASFKKAAKLDPKSREAQYNLAQVPFKKKDYAKARERFEALFERTPGGDKNQAAELIKFKIYMTLLLEGKESRAQSMMDQFQFTGDTPALYYAQAAWEFKHNNGEKAADWVASAKKIYSQPLNNIFADPLYDVGWMQAPETASAPAFDAGSLVASQTESSGAPAIEPSPIPDSVAASKQGEMAKTESTASSGSAVTTGPEGMEAQAGVSTSTESPASGTNAQPAQTSSPAESAGTVASSAETAAASSVSSGKAAQSPVAGTKPSQTAVSIAPAKAIASAWRIGVTGLKVTSHRTWLVGGLLLAGIFLLAWVIVPGLSRRYAFTVSDGWREKSFLTPPSLKPIAASPEKDAAPGNGFFGGPRQISARLTASGPSSRSGLYELVGSGRALPRAIEPHDGDSAGRTYRRDVADAPGTRLGTESKTTLAGQREEPSASSPVAEVAATPTTEPVAAAMTEPPAQEQAIPQMPPSREEPSASPPVAEVAATPAIEPVVAAMTEPLGQEQAIPQMPAAAMEPSIVQAIDEAPSYVASAITEQSVSSQIATPAIMSEQPKMTESPTASLMKAPIVETTAQPPNSMRNTVELTFSFEVASVQLTPTFKISALQVRPTSKVVTMRLARSQQAQLGMNSGVTFEISKIQPAEGAFGNIQVIPSQQKPMIDSSPSLTVAGLQMVPNLDSAPVWLTPSQEKPATVLVTVPFQITTMEFSASFEIASVVLNSTSKEVIVQLPGAAPTAAEGTPMFEIANLQLSQGGDIALMQLNLGG